MNDMYDLTRFVDAQQGVYENVVGELTAGEKRSHWMWFIFPQIEGLGYSGTAQKFAITCREEAQAYLDHKVLGARLIECTELVLQIRGRSLRAIFGTPDDLKFRSSMTLFAGVAGDLQIFDDALTNYFGGVPDGRTLDIVAAL